MTQIDFYLLASQQAEARLDFACRLAETIHHKGYRLYIHTGDESSAHAMQQKLWQFKADAFLPCGLLGQQPPSPIEIGWAEEPGDHHDVLLNLSLQVPACFARFRRVAEIINDAEEIKQKKREDWRFYKQRGYPIQAHDLRQRG